MQTPPPPPHPLEDTNPTKSYIQRAAQKKAEQEALEQQQKENIEAAKVEEHLNIVEPEYEEPAYEKEETDVLPHMPLLEPALEQLRTPVSRRWAPGPKPTPVFYEPPKPKGTLVESYEPRAYTISQDPFSGFPIQVYLPREKRAREEDIVESDPTSNLPGDTLLIPKSQNPKIDITETQPLEEREENIEDPNTWVIDQNEMVRKALKIV